VGLHVVDCHCSTYGKWAKAAHNPEVGGSNPPPAILDLTRTCDGASPFSLGKNRPSGPSFGPSPFAGIHRSRTRQDVISLQKESPHGVAQQTWFITLNSYLYDVFNPIFEDVRNFQGAVGIAAGTSYIANIGFHGDRERICLGTCANLAAKVIDGRDTITVTEEVYLNLPAALQEHFAEAEEVAGVKVYQATGLRWGDHPELAAQFGAVYDAEKLAKRTVEYRDAIPLHEMEITEATVLIDPDLLTERNSKRTSAVAIFVDIDGFTKYVQDAEDDAAVVSLVRQLHLIRHEFHAVMKQDYPGVVLQHQGDRVFGILHLPAGEEDLNKRCRKALDAAIGLQSSMEHVIGDKLPAQEKLHVAVGLDVGTALVTRLGKQGKRENVCLGREVTSAEKMQLRSPGTQIRISKVIYDAINDDTLREQFAKVRDGEYAADMLTFPKLDELQEEAAARSSKLGAVATADRIEVVTESPRQPRPWGNNKPWFSYPSGA
jgi:class 3 adenylate cyclase